MQCPANVLRDLSFMIFFGSDFLHVDFNIQQTLHSCIRGSGAQKPQIYMLVLAPNIRRGEILTHYTYNTIGH